MSQWTDVDLLNDLARLLVKHGPDAFESLSVRLRDGSLVDQLVVVVDSFAQAGRRSNRITRTGRAPRPGAGIGKLVQEYEVDNPEKAALLSRVYEALMRKALLPSLGEIRHFVEDNGLSRISADSRDKAVLPFVRSVAAWPTDRIISLLDEVSDFQPSGERTLEGWAGVILKDREKR